VIILGAGNPCPQALETRRSTMFLNWLGTKSFLLNVLIGLVVIAISLSMGSIVVAVLTALSLVCGLVTWYEYRSALRNM
jgi:hypothetical protein